MSQQAERATICNFAVNESWRDRVRLNSFAIILVGFVACVVIGLIPLMISTANDTDRGQFNAEEFDWTQLRGKTVEKAVPIENGTRVRLSFTDGTHVEFSSHKYSLSVN